jgi:hypothetical protein
MAHNQFGILILWLFVAVPVLQCLSHESINESKESTTNYMLQQKADECH